MIAFAYFFSQRIWRFSAICSPPYSVFLVFLGFFLYSKRIKHNEINLINHLNMLSHLNRVRLINDLTDWKNKQQWINSEEFCGNRQDEFHEMNHTPISCVDFTDISLFCSMYSAKIHFNLLLSTSFKRWTYQVQIHYLYRARIDLCLILIVINTVYINLIIDSSNRNIYLSICADCIFFMAKIYIACFFLMTKQFIHKSAEWSGFGYQIFHYYILSSKHSVNSQNGQHFGFYSNWKCDINWIFKCSNTTRN